MMNNKTKLKYLKGCAFEAEVSPGRQLQSEPPVDVDQVSVRGQEKVAIMSVLDLQKTEVEKMTESDMCVNGQNRTEQNPTEHKKTEDDSQTKQTSHVPGAKEQSFQLTKLQLSASLLNVYVDG